jgi:hypothetical protein
MFGDGDGEAVESIMAPTELRCLWRQNGVLAMHYVHDDIGAFTKYI